MLNQNIPKFSRFSRQHKYFSVRHGKLVTSEKIPPVTLAITAAIMLSSDLCQALLISDTAVALFTRDFSIGFLTLI